MRINRNCCIALFAVLGTVVHADSTSIEQARSAVKEWAATEQAISREQTEWQAKKQQLQDLIAIEEAKITKLQADIEAAQDSIGAVEQKRAALVDRQQAAAEQRQAVTQYLARLEKQVIALLSRLPGPLSEELAEAYAQVPIDPDESLLGVGERMQRVIAIVDGTRRFDDAITVSESIQVLPGSSDAVLVRRVFVGLGQAYYLSAQDAGVGRVTELGWEWQSQPEIADNVREVLNMIEGLEPEVDFVNLPVVGVQERK